MSEQLFNMRHRPAGAVRAEGALQTWSAAPARDGSVVFARETPVDALARGALLRLEHEARILRALDAPQLGRVIEVRLEANRACVAVSVNVGAPPTTLQDVLQGGPLPPNSTLEVARTLLLGLSAMHDAGLVHRDVRPQTVVWGPRPQLLTFPVTVHDLAHPSLHDPAWSHLLAYLSPEQAGLLHGGVDSRSDLYAVGAVLYACLSGRPPFEAPDVRSLLRQSIIAPLPTLGQAVPVMLERVIQRLLAKAPRDRYQTARGALADVERLQADLTAGRDDATFPLGLRDQRTVLGEPAMVGRGDEIEVLLGAVKRAPTVSSVESVSGGGKSRLLREVALRAAGSGALVVLAHADRRRATPPFPVLREILRILQGDGGDPVRAMVAARETALRPLSTPPARDADDVVGSARAVTRAVRHILEAASRVRPVLLLLDDCQWADESVLLLLRECADTRAPLAVVVAFRSEEVDADAPLRTMLGTPPLRLRPLSIDTLWDAVGSMAGPLPTPLRALVEQADGNPFVAVELIRGLVDSGVLLHDGSAWTLRDDAPPQVSARAAAALVPRLEALASPTRDVLMTCAPLGRSFTLEDALRAWDGPPDLLLPALADARGHGLIWSEAAPGRFTFAHNRLHEAVLARVTAQRQRAVHARVAAAYLRETPDDCYALASHLEQAGDVARAHPHARRAAADAHARHALDLAEVYYRIALRGAHDDGARAPVVEGLAEVLVRRGRYEEGAFMWRRAHALAQDDLGRARALGRLGEIGLKTGGHEAFAQLCEALALLGHPVPTNRVSTGLAIAREVGLQCLHSLLPKRFLATRDAASSGRDLLASTLLDKLKQLSGLESRFALTLWSHLRSLNTVERYPPTRQLGWAWIEHGEVLTLLAWFSRAQRYLERGLSLDETRGDPLQVARGLSRKGFFHYRRGELGQASALFAQALSHFVETSEEFWEIEIVRLYQARTAFLRGRTGWATAVARQVHEVLSQGGDPCVGNAALADVVRNTGGGVDGASIGEPSEELAPLANAELLMARGLWRLGQGDSLGAAQLFARSSMTTGRIEPPGHYVTRLCWEATAWRFAASRLSVGAGALRERYLQRARAAARRALRNATRARVNLPHALWESAVLAADRGREGQARRLFRDALKTAVEQENLYGFAWALYERGRVGAALGWQDAEANLADAHWAFRSIGLDASPLAAHRLPAPLAAPKPLPLSLQDRFLGLIEAGRAIVSTPDRQGILEAVRKAVADLLRPQVSRIVAAPSRPNGARAALALPLLVRDEPVAWVEAVHDEVHDYFQDEEHMLAAHLAALAGASLENAERFEALNALTRTAEAQSEQLRASLKEKEVMLREIHHRVKNNLQVIVSLLNLQLAHATDPTVASEFTAAADRLRSMSLVHEFVCASDDMSEIHMDDYLRTLVEHIVLSHGRSEVRVRFDLVPTQLPISLAVDCGLIVNELVSNALEHAFPRGQAGTLTVTLGPGDNGTRLVVADDGAGFDANARPSLGTSLIRILAEKVGTLTVESDAGTRAQLDLR